MYILDSEYTSEYTEIDNTRVYFKFYMNLKTKFIYRKNNIESNFYVKIVNTE